MKPAHLPSYAPGAPLEHSFEFSVDDLWKVGCKILEWAQSNKDHDHPAVVLMDRDQFNGLIMTYHLMLLERGYDRIAADRAARGFVRRCEEATGIKFASLYAGDDSGRVGWA